MKKANLRFGIFIASILLLTFLIAACQTNIPAPGTGPSGTTGKNNDLSGLKKFSSAQEIVDFLQKNSANSGFGQNYGSTRMIGAPIMAASFASDLAATPSANAGTAQEYSTTNVQVEGVDEADFVKNDGKYIYTLSQNKLVIVDAYPAENAKIVSETKIEGNPRNIFANKDRLVVFSDNNEQAYRISPYDYIPTPQYTQKIHALVYDISDKSNPKLVKDYNLNGYYLESRMIGDYVYFIAQENVYYYNNFVDIPVFMESKRTLLKPEVYYFDNPEYNYNFNTVASFNIFGNDNVNAKTFMMGYSNTIYVSQNNIYINYQKNIPYQTSNEHRFYDVVLPLLPSDVQSAINEIKKDDSINSYQKGDKISAALEEMYNRMNENAKQAMVDKINNAVSDYQAKLEAESRKTVIHKIKIDKGKIDYDSRGEVPGYLLNQFSLDENGDYLRVATTTEIYNYIPLRELPPSTKQSTVVKSNTNSGVAMPNSQDVQVIQPNIMPIRQPSIIMYNNVYVLDKNLKTVGKLEAIAPDEKIYSTRFLGNRLYLVTFKRIDPLFVIDLSNPEKPSILGELKIPGYSDYLHPYDETHLIGLGKDVDAETDSALVHEPGAIYYTAVKGLKLALFDVSDVENPKEISKYVIGTTGSDSEALYEHKAFLFDKKKNILVLPVTVVEGQPVYDNRLGYYMQKNWQGAYAFNVNVDNGFQLKGKITHNEGNENQNYYWYGYQNGVRRSLFMDDVLYTISQAKIKANDLKNVDKEIKEIKLPYEIERPYPPPMYGSTVGAPGIE